MNYNEEMANLFDEFSLDYKLEKLKEEDKAKPEDFIDLENRIRLREEDNRRFDSIRKKSTICLNLKNDGYVNEK